MVMASTSGMRPESLSLFQNVSVSLLSGQPVSRSGIQIYWPLKYFPITAFIRLPLPAMISSAMLFPCRITSTRPSHPLLFPGRPHRNTMGSAALLIPHLPQAFHGPPQNVPYVHQPGVSAAGRHTAGPFHRPG